MRTISPATIATIRLLIDCLIMEPERLLRFRVSVFEMSNPPVRARTSTPPVLL
jgi:hypothetical protein